MIKDQMLHDVYTKIDHIMELAYDYPCYILHSDGTISLDGTFDADLLRNLADILDETTIQAKGTDV